MSSQPVYERDGYRCFRCGQRATNVHHRNHIHSDDRASNKLAGCGSGTTGCHGWAERHRAAARAKGWEVTKHRPDAPLTVPVFLANHPLAPAPDGGWFLLDDGYGLRPCTETGEPL